MSTEQQLQAAKRMLRCAGIRSRRTRNPASPLHGPYLAVRHTDAQLADVCRIVQGVDLWAGRR